MPRVRSRADGHRVVDERPISFALYNVSIGTPFNLRCSRMKMAYAALSWAPGRRGRNRAGREPAPSDPGPRSPPSAAVNTLVKVAHAVGLAQDGKPLVGGEPSLLAVSSSEHDRQRTPLAPHPRMRDRGRWRFPATRYRSAPRRPAHVRARTAPPPRRRHACDCRCRN